MLYGIIAQRPLIVTPAGPTVHQGQAFFAGAGHLSALLRPPPAVHQAQAIFAGAGSLRTSVSKTYQIQATFAGAGFLRTDNVQNPVIAFTQTFNSDSGDAPGYSVRSICGTLSAGGSKIRVKITSGGLVGQGLNVNHVSIGKQNTTYNTTATPTELLFHGASGFSIPTTTTIYSDWTNFNTTIGDTLISILDRGSSPAFTRYNSAGGGPYYYQAAAASYNQSAPAGSWTLASFGIDVLEIDVGN